MSKSKRYLFLAAFLIIGIIVAMFLFFMWMEDKEVEEVRTNTNTNYTDYTPSGNQSQTVENPEVQANSDTDTTVNNAGEEIITPTVDNSDVAESIEVPEEVQTVIDEHAEDLNNEQVVDQLAQTYPSNVVPVYKADNAADSADIITANGKPGWTANYGSNATVEEIAGFYQELMAGTNNYAVDTQNDATNITGTIDNCDVSISITRNNPQHTGLDDVSSVSIFIERT